MRPGTAGVRHYLLCSCGHCRMLFAPLTCMHKYIHALSVARQHHDTMAPCTTPAAYLRSSTGDSARSVMFFTLTYSGQSRSWQNQGAPFACSRVLRKTLLSTRALLASRGTIKSAITALDAASRAAICALRPRGVGAPDIRFTIQRYTVAACLIRLDRNASAIPLPMWQDVWAWTRGCSYAIFTFV